MTEGQVFGNVGYLTCSVRNKAFLSAAGAPTVGNRWCRGLGVFGNDGFKHCNGCPALFITISED